MKLAKSQIFIIVINSILFLIGFVLMFSFSVNAQTVVDGELPYIVPNFQSVNTAINDSLMQATYQQLINTNKVQNDDTVLFFVTDLRSNLGQYEWNQMYYVCNPVVQTDVSGNYNYLTTNMTLSCEYFGTIEFKWNNTFRNIGQTYGSVSILGNTSTIDISQGSYTPRYPFYLVGNDLKYGDIVVFTNTIPFTPDIPTQGHATQPTNNPNNFINGSNGSPIVKPIFPTINYYTFTTYNPPSLDTTNLESLVESIYHLMQYNLSYLLDNLKGLFSNLIDNISNLVDYIVRSIENGFNKVISSIQDFITDIYNNFVSLFEPITNQLNYIVSPIDSNTIVSGISDTNFYNGFEDTKDFFNDVDAIFDIQEPDSFIIEIHLEDLDFFDSGFLDFNLSTVYLNLGANVIPFRNALRVFLWCLVSAGTVFYIQKNLPSMLKGDESGGTSNGK